LPQNGEYTRFDEVLEVLQTLYYDQEKINTGKMMENAIKAYVDALDDPYTVYLDSETNS
jgi:C-terminal processing protease CtpA/Prc